jgi:hypothetical protein
MTLPCSAVKGSMDVAENGDPVSQEQIVLQWLQTRGYGEAARRYEEEKQTGLEGTADGQAGGSHGILFRSLQNVRCCHPTLWSPTGALSAELLCM